MSFIIRLQNLSKTAKSANIREFFSNLSIPGGSVCIVGGDSGEAFIGFSTDEDARQAMLRDGLILCQNRVKLSLSSRKEMQEAMERAQQLSNMLKGLEKALRTDSVGSNNNQKSFAVNSQPERNDFLRSGLQIDDSSNQRSNPNVVYSQVNNDSIKAPSYNSTNSWLSDTNQPKQEEKADSSWKDFLEQALQRIEKAKGEPTQNEVQPIKSENKTGASILGPPRNFNAQQPPSSSTNFHTNQPPPSFNSNNKPPVGPPSHQNHNHFNQQSPPKSNNSHFPSFKPPSSKSHQYSQIHQVSNKPQTNNYRQNNPPSNYRQNVPKPQKRSSPPRFSPPAGNNKFVLKHFESNHPTEQSKPPPLMPENESDFEAILRQQQLAAVEQMPAIPQSFDPEELFVELSRLPPNLVEENECKKFLLPVVPLEIRMVYADDVHVITVIHCANKMDARNIIERNNEAGIKIRWSSRQAFFTLPPSKSVPLPQLNPQVWDFSASNDKQKRPSDQSYEIDAKRPKGQVPLFPPRQEPSWNDATKNSGPTKSLIDQMPTPLDPNRSYVLLSNVSFKANNWDVTSYVKESNINPLKTTHVYSPDSERSDKWLIECASLGDSKKLVESRLLLLGRSIKAESLTQIDAQDIYTNGYRKQWSNRQLPDKRPIVNQQNNSTQKSFFGGPTSAPNQNSQNSQQPRPTKPPTSGFFTAPAYGKIRSATKPNPSDASFQPRKSDNLMEENEEHSDNGRNFRGSHRGRGASNYNGRGFHHQNKSFGSYQQGGFRGRGGNSNFRGRGGFKNGRDGNDSEVAT